MHGFAGMVAFLAAILCCENADRLGRLLGVIDRPDGGRKQHVGPTPLVGGLALALPLIVLELTWLATHPSQERLFLGLLLATAGFWLLGYADDRYDLRPRHRIVAAILLFALILVIEPKMVLTQLYFGPPLWTVQLGVLAVPFTLLCLVGLTNAINMADGRNGVVLGIAICWAYGLSEYAHVLLQPYLYFLIVCLVTALVYNWSGRLFLGNSGSHMLGALLGLQTIYFYNDPRSDFPAAAAALWLLVPVLDCLRLFVVRLCQGRSPWSADLQHLHHHLNRRLPWHQALPTYLAVSAAPGFLALLWPQASFQLVLMTVALYIGILLWSRRPAPAGSPTPKPLRQQ